MNKDRRKKLNDIIAILEDAKEALDNCASEEREYFENMPENMQSSDKACNAENAAGELESAVGYLECALDNINNALEQ